MNVHASDRKQGSSQSSYSKSHSETEEWKLAQRITSTPVFQRSAFLTNFLLYICDRKLSNREDEITEYQIGVQALGRPAAYHPGEDNIVRNYARMLRKRLEEYFAEEGRNEALRIVVPRGQYVPTFEPNANSEAPIDADIEQTSDQASLAEAARRPKRHLSTWSKAGIIIASLAVALSVGWMFWHGHNQTSTLYERFWGEILNPKRETYIVTGDSGFALLQDMTQRKVGLPEYVNGDLDKWFPSLNAINHHNSDNFDADRLSGYTSVADLNAVVGILRQPESAIGNTVVRNARDMHMGDIRQSNLVLLGGPLANPWVELFQPLSEFHLEFAALLDERSIVNEHPRPGEQAVYRYIPNVGQHLTYAILSFLPSMDGEGHVLLIQGLNISGTQAGVNFALNQSAMMPILKKAQTKDGSIGRFEVLLETQSIGASAPDAHPIAERFGPSAQ